MNKTILKTTILGLAMLITLPLATNLVGNASAQQRYGDYMRQGRGSITVRTDRNFFMRHNMFRRHRVFYRYFPRYVVPSRVIVYDRDYPFYNDIYLNNRFTGPGSVNINYVRLGLRHSDFLRLRNDIDIDNNISVSVNTGNNTVEFNTIVGDFSTGDVNISIR